MIQRIKFFIYSIVLFLATNKRVSKKKLILVVKTDEIGDYVLWRNTAHFLKTAPRFQGYSFILCGNRAWKNIAENFDKQDFDDFIWLDKKKFKSDMRYRYRFLKNINRSGFEIVINPVFSRSIRLDDAIVKAASAGRNIGMTPNETNRLPFEKGYDKNLYHELIDLPAGNIFDYYRNKLFIEKVTGSSIPANFSFDKSSLERPAELPENYFIIFPGSNNPSRIWSTANFIETAKFVHEFYNYHTIVCGGPGDQSYIDAFISSYPYPCLRFIEKKGLTDFLNALAFAKCLISVDTGAVHLAAAVQCPVYGIFNGSLYKRFAPYPIEIHKDFYAIYPDIVEKEIRETISIPARYRYLSDVSYNEVTAQKVIGVIRSSL